MKLNESATTDVLQVFSGISEKYNAVNRATGKDFNIFKVLKLDRKEVRTHNAFLAELLNPEGWHGQGALFLTLFVEHFKIPGFQSGKAKVLIEKRFGVKDDENVKGGQIDLVIRPANGIPIVIENKIDAKDQDKQLNRYFNTFNGQCHLLYISLDGRDASDPSKGSLQSTDYKRIAYHERSIVSDTKENSTITQWLEKCLANTIRLPFLREILIQYIDLIYMLTGDTTNSAMTVEIAKKIAQRPDWILALYQMPSVYDDLKSELAKRFIKDIQKLEIIGLLQLMESQNQFEFYNDNYLYFGNDSDHYTLSIYIEGQDFGIGIEKADESKRDYDKKINEALNSGLDQQTESWPWYKPFPEYRNFDSNGLLFAAIVNGELQDFLKKEIGDIIGKLNDVGLTFGKLNALEP